MFSNDEACKSGGLHARDQPSYRAGLWIDYDAGTGVTYFVTGMPDAPLGRHSGFSVIEEKLARGMQPPTKA